MHGVSLGRANLSPRQTLDGSNDGASVEKTLFAFDESQV